ncbi:MAG: adenosylcobinamide-GDP ribazoletransferase [Planctomycetota bacterium]|jgi:adenosylcobinamide-GDP ribazoletransferase
MRAGGLTTAFRTLTILSLPGREEGGTAAALPWFPAVGLVMGAALYGLTALAGLSPWGAWPAGAAFLVVAGGVVLTRGLHLDGLADAADALGSLAPRERMLAIMKDSAVGAFGVLALVLVLGAKWIAVARLVESGTAGWIVAAYVVSRAAQVELAVVLPYARAEGGTARAFVRDARGAHRAGSWALALVMVTLVCGPAGVAALVGGWLLARALGWRFIKALGGVTGDLLGATSEIVETAVLFACAAAGARLAAWAGWGIVMDALQRGTAG